MGRAGRVRSNSARGIRPVARWVLVGSTRVEPPEQEHASDGIIDDFVSETVTAGFTGTVMLRGSFFALVLEGTSSRVAARVRLLGADPRCQDVVVVRKQPSVQRWFESFTLAYIGRSFFVERTILEAWAATKNGAPAAVERLALLMRAFGR